MARRGRPRAFGEDEVRRSVYAAFGNREALFTIALERYLAGHGAFAAKALALPTARESAEPFLRDSVEAFASSDCPSGCMAVQSVLACGEAGAAVRSDLAAWRKAAIDAFPERFDRAQLDGDMPADVDTVALAGYIVALSNGIAVQASSGSERPAVSRMVEFAMATWPSP